MSRVKATGMPALYYFYFGTFPLLRWAWQCCCSDPLPPVFSSGGAARRPTHASHRQLSPTRRHNYISPKTGTHSSFVSFTIPSQHLLTAARRSSPTAKLDSVNLSARDLGLFSHNTKGAQGSQHVHHDNNHRRPHDGDSHPPRRPPQWRTIMLPRLRNRPPSASFNASHRQ